MIQLKDRQKQIPYGISFYLPQTKWRPKPGSFENVSQQLQRHLQANPVVTKQLGLSLDIENIRNIVDLYNAKVCQKMNWTEYIVDSGGQSPPKMFPRVTGEWNAGQAVAAGANTLKDWLGAGGGPVAQELANARAKVCAGCDKNDKNHPETYEGDWTRYFTKPAAAFIQKMLEKRAEMKMTTTDDANIDVCMACLCPLKLKVFCPVAHIAARMPDFVKADLDPKCWVLSELK